ncbi:MAG: twin-arginine translocase subunit TatC [Myxococcales bacterium]|nr:twin-arginine translocase subunit TatC [Myxococcales bacterium]
MTQATPKATDELADGGMPFLEHLRELSGRLRNAMIAFLLAFGACWYFSEEIYAWLMVPLQNAWAASPNLTEPMEMHFAALLEPFWVYMSVALWAGIFVSSPFTFYQLWSFIAPGLYKRERNIGIAFAIASAGFFCAGAAFCYYLVLDPMYGYFLSFAVPGRTPTLFMTQYLDLTRNMMLGFGAIFELPIFIMVLAALGLVTHRSLWKFNRWFVILAFIIGAILTPSPDVVTQCLMAFPMIALYNVAIIGAYFITKGRERKAAAELADD